MKAVGVFHQEFARTQNSKPGTFFVAKLCLNLIDGQRHLPVAADMARHQVCHDLFVRWTKSKMHVAIAAAHVEIDQHVSEGLFSSRPFEQIDWLEGWHQDFKGTGPIHFLSNDGFRLLQRANAQGKIRVGPGHQLPDETGSKHELMTGDFGVRRNFLHRRDKCLRPAHSRFLSECVGRCAGSVFRGFDGVKSREERGAHLAASSRTSFAT